MFNFPGINVNYPNFSTVISFYTLVYLVIPMIENSQFNPSVVIILTILSFISAYNQKEKYCTDLLGIFLSIILGTIIAFIWYTIFAISDKKIYYSTMNYFPTM